MFTDPNLKEVEVLNGPMKGKYTKGITNSYPSFESENIKAFMDTSIMGVSVIYKDTGNYVFENNELPTWELVSSSGGLLKIRFIDYND
jgi:hypothetical protein